MESEKTVQEIVSQIRSGLDKDISNLDSAKHGIILLDKSLIVSYNAVIRSFFPVAQNREISGMDISTVLPPDTISKKMLIQDDETSVFQKNLTLTDYTGMQVDLVLISFSHSKDNTIHRVLVFENMAECIRYARQGSQMINNVLSNVFSFIQEIQNFPENKDITKKILNHISVISKANIVAYSVFKNKNTMYLKDYIIADQKYQPLSKLINGIKNLEMTPGEYALRNMRSQKVHEAPVDLRELSFNVMDPVQIERFTQMFSLLKVYSFGINYKNHLLAVVTMYYDSNPGQIYLPALNLYSLNVAPLLFQRNPPSKLVIENNVPDVIDSMHMPAAVVNDKEIFINCNSRFERLLKVNEKESLIGKSTREIADRVEFDNFLTNIYMRKKKISGIYNATLVDKEKKTINVTILAGPYFEKEEFKGAFGVFLRMPDDNDKDASYDILPDDVPVKYLISNVKGKILKTNCYTEDQNVNEITDFLERCIGELNVSFGDIHRDMQTRNLYLVSITCPNQKSRILIFRQLDQKKEHFIYFINDDVSLTEDKQTAFIKEFAANAGIALIIIESSDGNIEYVNDEMTRLSGFNSAELSGRSHKSLFDFPGDNTFKEFRKKYMSEFNSGETIRTDLLLKTKGNKIIYVGVVAIRIEINDSNKYFVFISRSASDKDKANGKSGETTHHNSFPMAISEARTPLNNLLGLCQLASEETNPVRKNEFISAIHDNSVFINKLFDDVLEMQKIENGTIPVSVTDIDLVFLLGNVHENINKILRSEKNKKMIAELMMPEVAFVNKFYSDSDKIFQVFNLISNILVQVRKNGKISVGIREYDSKGTVNFYIRYQANGQKEIFQYISSPVHFLFEKNDVVSELQFRLCKLIIELLGGKYSLYSDYDYQEFAFSVPSHKKALKSKVLLNNQYSFNGQNILVMTTDKAIMTSFSERFSKIGLNADYVEDGIKVLGLVRKKKYDIVILDLTLDNFDGIETIWTLRHKGNKIPVIALFELENPVLRDKCMKLGCTDFITKPVNESIMIHKLNRILITK